LKTIPAPARLFIILCILWGCASSPQSLTTRNIPDSQPVTQSADVAYTNYWTAIRHLALERAYLGWPEKDHQQFTRAVELQIQDETTAAENIFKELALTAKDQAVRHHALRIITDIYWSRGDWQAILDLSLDSGNKFRKIADAFNTMPSVEYHFGNYPGYLKIARWNRACDCGTPHVKIAINGRQACLMIDTGASVSMISASVAERCGIQPISHHFFRNAGATGKAFRFRLAVADKIIMSGLTINNKPLFIVTDEDMARKKWGRTRSRLQGVIGWDILQKMKITVYGKEGLIRIQKAEKEVSTSTLQPFFWLKKPVVKLRSDNGRPLYFMFDSGASKTWLFPPILHKLGIQDYRRQKEHIWSFGGRKRVKAQLLPEMTLWLGDQRLEFKNINTIPLLSGFVRLDGVLGADLLHKGETTIDPHNGVFEHIPAPKEETAAL